MSDEVAGPHVEFARAAQRDLRQLDPQIRRRVLAAIDGLLTDPPRGDVQRLTATGGEYRLRVGDWRVRFVSSQDKQLVTIKRVLPRGRALPGTDGRSTVISGQRGFESRRGASEPS